MRKAIGLAMFGGAVIGLNIAAPAYAQTGKYSDTVYYSDVSQTEVVGEDVVYCDGHEIFLGRPSGYGFTTFFSCPN